MATKAKVVLIADTPYPGEDVPDCLATHPKKIQACAAGRGRALQFPAQRRAESRAAVNAGALVIDPSPWFCSGTVCPAVIGHKVVYADKEHMTATYSAWLAPALSARLPALP